MLDRSHTRTKFTDSSLEWMMQVNPGIPEPIEEGNGFSLSTLSTLHAQRKSAAANRWQNFLVARRYEWSHNPKGGSRWE
jgi:hypothetical protein